MCVDVFNALLMIISRCVKKAFQTVLPVNMKCMRVFPENLAIGYFSIMSLGIHEKNFNGNMFVHQKMSTWWFPKSWG